MNPFLGQGYFSQKLHDNKMTKPSEGLRRPRPRAPSCAKLSFLNPNGPSAESLLICHKIILHHQVSSAQIVSPNLDTRVGLRGQKKRGRVSRFCCLRVGVERNRNQETGSFQELLELVISGRCKHSRYPHKTPGIKNSCEMTRTSSAPSFHIYKSFETQS